MPTELVLPCRAALLAALRPRLTGPAWTLLIDGGSGSGKTTLAAWLAPRLQAEVVAMEALYPGWSGLAAAADLLATRVLPARAAGRAVSWREWDWAARAPGSHVVLHPGRPVIVEGCGSLTPRSRPFASVALLLQVDDGLRARRAEQRDPLTRHGRLAAWRDDERRLQAREHPVADLVLRGGVASAQGGSVHAGSVRVRSADGGDEAGDELRRVGEAP